MLFRYRAFRRNIRFSEWNPTRHRSDRYTFSPILYSTIIANNTTIANIITSFLYFFLTFTIIILFYKDNINIKYFIELRYFVACLAFFMPVLQARPIKPPFRGGFIGLVVNIIFGDNFIIFPVVKFNFFNSTL